MDFWDNLDVSRETFHKLEVYKERLLLWNKKINLISKRSTDDVWGRHFLSGTFFVDRPDAGARRDPDRYCARLD